MMISLRTKMFDAASLMEEGTFHGEDFAKWLQSKFLGWKLDIVDEDWGWSVYGKKERFRYNFGIYDLDTDDVNDNGPKWILRIYNERDWRSWFKSWVKYTPPVAHKEVVEEVLEILKAEPNIKEIEVEPLS
jgi:hypothetical protein